MAEELKTPSFGALAGLIGTWKGVKGWSLISVPAHNANDPSAPKFKLIVQNYTETLTFKAIDAPVENKGGTQTQDIGAIEYIQRIHDFDTKELIHVENGMFMYLKDVSGIDGSKPPFSIARSATVPHGNSLLILGDAQVTDGAPEIPLFSSKPSEEDQQGAPSDYFSQFEAEQKKQITKDIVTGDESSKIFDVLEPNANLIRDNNGLEIVNSTHITLDSRNQGNISNIPFLVKHATASNASSDFWIETVKLPMSDQTFQQLQYSQTVDLEFHKKFNGQPGVIKWPHVTVNTLTKQD